ncbi:MAG: cereblon family protein [Myxococcota bacterium]
MPGWVARKQPSEPSHNEFPDAAQPTADVTGKPEDTSYVCARCGAFLARRSDQLTVDGKTLHERVNPVGFPHRFMTLTRCEAASPIDEPTTDFTWFEGCAWQVVLCAGCRVHLGWHFQGEGRSFWGVLVERMKEVSATE